MKEIPFWLLAIAIALVLCWVISACEVHMPLSGVGKTEVHVEATSGTATVDEKKPDAPEEYPAK